MFVVIENTPGYLPEVDDPAEFEDYAEAVVFMQEEIERYVETIKEVGGKPEVEVGWASPDNLAAAMVYDLSREHDLGRYFGVERDDEEES